MNFRIKKRRPSRLRNVPKLAEEAAERMTDFSLTQEAQVSKPIVSLDEMATKEFSHTAKLPEEAEPIGCVMVVLAKDKQGRVGAMVSGWPTMDYFALQDMMDAGDKMLKNLIRYTNPPKQDLSNIIIPGSSHLPPFPGR